MIETRKRDMTRDVKYVYIYGFSMRGDALLNRVLVGLAQTTNKRKPPHYSTPNQMGRIKQRGSC